MFVSHWPRWHSLAIIFAALTAVPARCAVLPEKQAASMRDLRTHFAACFQPPPEADTSQITFYFALKSDGEVFGQPRVTWPDSNVSTGDRKRLISASLSAFEQCLPLRLSLGFASTIPGKVYFLQFTIGAAGAKDMTVMLRPYGSSGYPLADAPRRR